jgi:hypothetical protein
VALGRPNNVLTTLTMKMFACGMSRCATESSLEHALGQFVRSKSAIHGSTDHVTQAYDMFQTRDLSGNELADVMIDTLYKP